jgi:hypothetical protein
MEPGGIKSGDCGRPSGCRKSLMDKPMLTSPDAITVPQSPPTLGNETNFMAECRNLIRILSFTIDSLCDDSGEDDRKLRNIRSLIAALSTVESLAEDLGFQLTGVPAPVYRDDINGVHYIAINTCELERFSVK